MHTEVFHRLALRRRDGDAAVDPVSRTQPGAGEGQRDGLLYLVLDGTLIPIDRVRADGPFYSGKYRKHGMNPQVIASPDGTLVWVSGPLPGSVLDRKAARIWSLVREPAASGILVLADKGYVGVARTSRRPTKARTKPSLARTPTAPTPGSADRVNGPTPSSRAGRS